MEEHAKAELHLSEEQLQAITGGCGQCTADLARASEQSALANYHNTKVASLTAQVPHMQNIQDLQALQRLTQAHINQASRHNQQFQNLLNGVVASTLSSFK